VDPSAETLVGIFDRAGIVAFAFSGVEVGSRKRLDIFGLVVMGIVTAGGGGVFRDLLLDRTPLLLVREDYLLLATLASLAAIPLIARDWRWLRWAVAIASAVGLGAFAVAGALAGIAAGLPLPAVLLLAVLTATGGGVIRDLFADEVPLVLRTELNATAAAAGGLAVWALEDWQRGAAALAGALVTTGLRLASVAFGVQLPAPAGRDR
jgi:uncharacterized membrane protein YeiH